MDWWLTFRNPFEIVANHFSFLVCEQLFNIFGLLTLFHAVRKGERYLHVWISAFLHGLVVETLCYFVPEIDNFWHAQSTIMLIGQRLPIHITFLYPVFYYIAFISASTLLCKTIQPFAVGFLVVLLDIPFDIMGIKLLWWSWHDTDPVFEDRSYWVPITSYLFHLTFASSFTALFWGTRKMFSQYDDITADRWWVEMICNIIAGLLSMPCGVIQLILLYHLPHDVFHVHSEVCLILTLLLYGLMVFLATSHWTEKQQTKTYLSFANFNEIHICVILHFVFYIVLVLIERPEKIHSIGIHQPIYDCDSSLPVITPLGMTLPRKKFLCPSNYNEDYFTLNCTNVVPSVGKKILQWYSICGTPFKNHAEYMLVVSMFSVFGLIIFIHLLSNTLKSSMPSKKVKHN